MIKQLGPYGRDAYEDHNMLTTRRDGVVHQAWFMGSWYDVETRCGLTFRVSNGRGMQKAEELPVDCMLCLDAISETAASATSQAEKRRRAGA